MTRRAGGSACFTRRSLPRTRRGCCVLDAESQAAVEEAYARAGVPFERCSTRRRSGAAQPRDHRQEKTQPPSHDNRGDRNEG